MFTQGKEMRGYFKRNPLFGFAAFAFGITATLVAYKYLIEPRLKIRKLREAEQFANIILRERDENRKEL